MATRMLIDATHPEETRVVVVKGNRLEEFDFESASRRPLKGNIYLARVTRVEPALQAAFVEYGGNRHGFLAFSEIHPDYYQIPVADRQRLLELQAAEEAAIDAQVEAEAQAAEGRADEDISNVVEVDTGEDVIEEIHGGESESGVMALGIEPETLGGPFVASDGAPGLAGDRVDEQPAPEAGAHAGEMDAGASPAGDIAPGGAENAEPADAADSIGSDDGAAEPQAATPARPAEAGDDDAEDARDLARKRRQYLRNYKIQEVIKRRQIMLVQVVKEERGNKGAALTTYLSLAGRYCVLMPNSARGGGISRKIANPSDRKRLKGIVDDLDVPEGMGVILRTAGMDRAKPEIKRDFDYLLRLWDSVRELTLRSQAPCLVYEEGSLIKRSIRDYYSSDIEEILVEGEDAYHQAREFMAMIMPGHVDKVRLYKDPIHLLHRYQIEQQFDSMYSPTVSLKSGGYIVINPTEALVSIDVNSGKSTREHNIEETAFKTNLEAAEEIARQLRLRDLAGLIVIDFIDMEEGRNNRNVERRLKECLKADRARIQVGRISPFGLLEMSRQRLRPSLLESSTRTCPHCGGLGYIRSTDSTALYLLRAIEEEAMRERTQELTVHVATSVAMYILNMKREALQGIEARYGIRVLFEGDDSLIPPAHKIERSRQKQPSPQARAAISAESVRPSDIETPSPEVEEEEAEVQAEESTGEDGQDDSSRRRRRRRRRRPRRGEEAAESEQAGETAGESASGDAGEGEGEDGETDEAAGDLAADAGAGEEGDGDGSARRRRRGRRGGRRRRRGDEQEEHRDIQPDQTAHADAEPAAQPGIAPEQVESPAMIEYRSEAAMPAALEPAAGETAPAEVTRVERQATEPAPAELASAGMAERELAPGMLATAEPLAAEAAPAPAAAEPAKPRRFGWWRRRNGEGQ
ncbi:MAG: Rne/Rng family ribonuclease [Alphaproteobacteria bacterium]|nr:Rne/Rng family ribonuclease [Alphaproteobacteria bacterium]